MKKRGILSLLALTASLILILALLWLAPPTCANPGLQCVNQTGSGCDAACNGCYSSVQAALNAAANGDEIRIAGGTYSDPGGTVATITKEVWVTGGYDSTCSVHDPDLYPTALDAQGGGSVIKIVNTGDVGLMHLTLTGGDGTGNCAPHGCGGGLYATGTILHVGHCLVTGNVASTATGRAMGGGIYAHDSAVEIWETHVVSNTAGTAATDDYADGGGVYVQGGTAELRYNEISDNVGSVPYSGSGGVHLEGLTHARVLTNTIWGNRSNLSSYWSSAGGLYIRYSSDVYVASNRIEGNSAGFASGYGGGVYVDESEVHLTRNVIADNSGGTWNGAGDGVAIHSTLPVTLSNNLIARNIGGSFGEGVFVERYGPPASQVQLYNNTIVYNGIHGILASYYATVTMTNNLVAGHEMGITQTHPASSTVVADTNLFWNGLDLTVGNNAIEDEPRLTPDYRLRRGSPALNAGLPILWLTADLDGNPRP
ncbi:MAG: right-handed parallel beta-helix repeat-containing protein [Anaerolineae bacterium]|nr:MAG: right-handed parallel beta-helix repeat-containing protein [Anaerolineae bacterium]